MDQGILICWGLGDASIMGGYSSHFYLLSVHSREMLQGVSVLVTRSYLQMV